MSFARRAWFRLRALLRTGQRSHARRWIEPANTVTQAIESGRARALPPPPRYARRPVTLRDFPALALALRELTEGTLQPAIPQTPPTAEQPRERPSPERRHPVVSTRSARRRRRHAA